MDKNEIGRLIEYERNKQGIPLSQLSYGLCSSSVLQRLENGERMVDYFTLERFMERLGKSMNKMEILFDKDAYEIFYLREIIERELEKGNYGEIKEALEYYQTLKVADTSIHRQYILQMRAILMDVDNLDEKAQCLEAALKETVPDFQIQCLEKYRLGEEELIILLQWGETKVRQKELSPDTVGKRFMDYAKALCKDEEVAVNVISKVAWVFSNLEMEQGNFDKALEYALEGEKILTENKVILYLPEFLDRILALTQGRDEDTYQEWKEQRDALKALYEEYGENWTTGGVQLWKKFRQQEGYLISQTFEQERSLLNQSQEYVAEELEMDQKTISRIETGKYKPKPTTFQKMKDYYKMDRDIYSTRIVVDDFQLLELEREISIKSSERQWEEMECLYEGLKAKLSMRYRENQQYVKYMDMLCAHVQKRISDEAAMEQCIEAFHITRGKIKTLEQITKIVLSRREGLILNYLTGLYDKKERYDISTSILEAIVKGYESSRVDIKHHYVVLSLVSQHLVFTYDRWDKFDEAIKWADKTILYDFKCKRGMNLGYIRDEKQYILDQMAGTYEKGREKHRQCMLILKVLKKKTQMKALETWYKNTYEKSTL